MVEAYDISETTKTTELLCNEMAASSLMLHLDDSQYQNIKGVSYWLAGIALDGMQIEYPYHETKWDEGLGPVDQVAHNYDKMDMCLSAPNDDGVPVYRSLSPCIIDGDKENTPGDCADDEVCDNNNHDGPWLTAIKTWSNTQEFGGAVGLARDGHVIYGPYDENGEVWDCDDHDICNGVWFSNDMYGYVVTPTFPYVLGCYGPGEIQYYPVEASCSTNSCYACQGLNAATATLAVLYLLIQ